MHVTRLGEVCEINPRMPKSLADDDAASFLPMAAVSEEGQIAFEEQREVGEVKKGYTYFERGDVLVAKITPCFENGKAARTLSLSNPIGFGSTEFHVLRAGEEIDASYLFHLIWNTRFREVGANNMTGSAGQKRIPADFLKRLEIPLPPLDEQRRIAVILDKADALRRKRKRALELLDGLTHSIFLEMFGDPAKPVSHGSKLLGQTLIEIGSGWSPICLDRPATDGEPGILKLGAITAGSFRQDQNKALPPNLSPKPEAEIRDGDILFCRKNTKELVGSSVYVWQTRPSLYMSDLIFKLVPNPEVIDPIFLQAQLSLPSQRRNISDLAGGAAGSMPNISKARLRDLTVLVPELGAQKRFADITHQSRAVWSTQSRSAADANMLFSSLQHRAFAGELL